MTSSILLVDDYVIFRNGVWILLEATAESGRSAVQYEKIRVAGPSQRNLSMI